MMKIIIYDIVKILADKKKTKKNIDYIHDNYYILYFWNYLDKYEEEGISKYGGFITYNNLKELLGKDNIIEFEYGRIRFYIYK